MRYLACQCKKPGQQSLFQEMSTRLSEISCRPCCERFNLGKCVLLKKTMCHVEMLLVVQDAPPSTSAWPRPCSRAALMLGWIPASCCFTVIQTENSFCMTALVQILGIVLGNGRDLCKFISILILVLCFFYTGLPSRVASPRQFVVNFPSADFRRLPVLKAGGPGNLNT